MLREKGVTIMYSHKWAVALAVAALFALQPTASNAQSRIGSANSVKPDASGTIAGTLSAGSSIHANETVKTGSSGQAGLGFIDKTTLMLGLHQLYDLTSLSTTQTRALRASSSMLRRVRLDSRLVPRVGAMFRSRPRMELSAFVARSLAGVFTV